MGYFCKNFQLTANVQSTHAANVCSRWGTFARMFCAKPT